MNRIKYFICFLCVGIVTMLCCDAWGAQSTNETKGAPWPSTSVKQPTVTEAVSNHGYVPTENDIKSFVYRWFAWLDHEVEGFLLLYHIAKDDLQMEVPGATIRTHKDFVAWYARERSEIKSSGYQVSDIKIKELPQGRFSAEIFVRHKGVGVEGKAFDNKYRYSWELSVSEAGRLTIYRYRVKKVK